MKSLRMFMAGMAVMCVAGCSKPGIVGSWEGTKDLGQANATFRASFAGDKKFTVDTEIASAMGSMKSRQSGTYELKDKQIILTAKEGQLNGKPIPLGSAKPVTQSFEVKGDKLTLGTGGADTLVLTRVKK